jgi:hypothetical protein
MKQITITTTIRLTDDPTFSEIIVSTISPLNLHISAEYFIENYLEPKFSLWLSYLDTEDYKLIIDRKLINLLLPLSAFVDPEDDKVSLVLLYR